MSSGADTWLSNQQHQGPWVPSSVPHPRFPSSSQHGMLGVIGLCPQSWPSPSCFGHHEREPAYGKSLCISVNLSLYLCLLGESFFLRFTYLKGTVSEKGEIIHLSLVHASPPHPPMAARQLDQAEARSPKPHPALPHGRQGMQVLGPCSAAFTGTSTGSWSSWDSKLHSNHSYEMV